MTWTSHQCQTETCDMVTGDLAKYGMFVETTDPGVEGALTVEVGQADDLSSMDQELIDTIIRGVALGVGVGAGSVGVSELLKRHAATVARDEPDDDLDQVEVTEFDSDHYEDEIRELLEEL